MESYKKEFLKLKYFSPIKILTSHFIWRDSWSFLSFFLCCFFQYFFFLFFSLFFYAPFLEDLRVLMILEEKITSSTTSFQMK
jgi:hypothetical protein